MNTRERQTENMEKLEESPADILKFITT